MVQNKNALFRFLLLYYLEDLSSPPIYDEIIESSNQDEVIMKYIAVWAQWDEKLKKAIRNNE